MTANSSQLQQLYVAYFGRAADPTGLDYWETKGITTAKFAADMYAQAEFQDAYGSLSTESQVNQIYQNLFDRDADAAGLLYWTKQIDLGNLKLAEIANDLIWAAENNSGSEDDKTALANKTAAATAYTAKVKETTAAILAYQAESTSPWKSGVNIAEAISYMSGIDKDTASTTAGIAASVTTITGNGVPSLASNYSLTSSVDDIDGTAGTNKINAGLTSSGNNTLNSLDTIDGGAGTDTLNASIKTAVTPGEVKNVENVNVTFEAGVTLNAVNFTGVTTFTDAGSTAAGTISNIGDTSSGLKVSDNSVGSTFTYQANAVTGTADSIDLTLANVTGNAATTITGAVETVNLTSSTSANTVKLDSDATTLNISGSADLTLSATSTVLNLTTVIDASAATGAITLAHDHTGSSAVTITGGSGNDSLTASGGTSATDTVSGGAGNDTITFTTDLADADIINGGAGTDTLVSTSSLLVALTTANNVSNIEVLQASDVLAAETLTTANVDSTLSSVTLTAGANVGVVTFGSGSATLGMGTASLGGLTVNDTGLATDDTLTINASTVDGFNANSVAINGFETVNFNTGTGATTASQDVSTFNVTGDPDSAGERTDVTLTITGKGNFTNSGAITLGTDGSGEGTLDASGMTGSLIMSAAVAGANTITGGAGNDTLVSDSHASTLTGGAGNDTFTGSAKADTITGGTGNDIFNLTEAGTLYGDTVTGGAGNDTFQGLDAVLDAAHVLSGGAGTDTIKLTDINAVTDGQFENNTSIEVLTSASSGLAATLDVYAQAMGITTVTFAGTVNGGIADTVTIQNDVTNAITVNLDAAVANDTNTVDATNYTGVLTIVAGVDTALNADTGVTSTLTGGTGTSDTLKIVGDTYTAAQLASVTAIENWTVTDDASATITTGDVNVADGKSLVIDGRAIISANKVLTVSAILEADGAVTVHGGTGADAITGTISDLGDTVYGYAGADTINVGAAYLTTLDTIDGGAGADVLTLTTAVATITDADFTNVTNIEHLTFGVASTDTDLGAEYVESGSTTITLTTGTNDLNLDSVTTAQTLNVVGGTDTIDASSMTAALTVKVAESKSITSADTITAGTSTSDELQLTFANTAAALDGVTGFETIKNATNAAQTITTVDANVASTKSMTIDMSANTSTTGTVSIAAETDGAISVIGGSTTNVTLSVSSMGDTFTGTGTGTDGLTVAIAQLTSADTLNGVSGTDTLNFSDAGVLSDADLTGVTNFDTLVLADGANTIVLGAEFEESGIATLTGSTGADTVTYGSGVTSAVTHALGSSAGDDTISAEAATGAFTFTITEDGLDASDTITGSSTASDTLTITFDDDTSDVVTATEMSGVTKVDTIKTASNAVGSLALHDNNTVSGVIAINAVLNTGDAFTLDASAENDGTITYTGGAGIDTVTGTATTATGDTISSGAGADVITGGGGGDTITGGADADTFTYTAVADSTGSARDSITDFTSGTDKFSFTIDNSSNTSAQTYDATIQTARAGTSLVQSNLSGSIGQAIYDTTNSRLIINANADNLVSTLDWQIDVNAATTAASTLASGDINYTISGGSGEDTITTGGGADTIVTGAGGGTVTAGDGDDNVTGGAGVDVIVGGAGDDTIDGGAGADTISSVSGANTITGGSGADTITGGTGVDIVKWTATSLALMATEVGATAGTGDFATGTSGDDLISWTSAADKLYFAQALLTNADGTEVDTLKSIASNGTIAATDRFVEITTAINGTTADAIAKIDATTSTDVQINDTFVAFMNDGTDGYLFLVEQESTADTIDANDICVIGQVSGVTDVANGDFVSF